ncbi:MAG: hypothetical protein WC455_08060 [Dehalococcoidia bacterium]|jgi:hypothetical protein
MTERKMEVKIHEVFEIHIHGNNLTGPMAYLEFMPNCVYLLSASQSKGPNDAEGSTTYSFKFLPLWVADSYINFLLLAVDGHQQEGITYRLLIREA